MYKTVGYDMKETSSLYVTWNSLEMDREGHEEVICCLEKSNHYS